MNQSQFHRADPVFQGAVVIENVFVSCGAVLEAVHVHLNDVSECVRVCVY